jgi:hypothetical protein
MCLEFNDAIALEWGAAGGPFQGPALDRDRYIPLRRAWYMEQKQSNILLMQIEVAVGYEKAWVKEHMGKTTSIWKLNTSVKAMHIATVERKYPAVLRIEPAVSQTGVKKRKRAVAGTEKSKNTVSFATTQTCRSCWVVDGDHPETAIDENVDETKQVQYDPEAVYHYRKMPEYYRSEASYTPGDYAAQTELGWLDMSHSEDLILSDIKNMKLFVTKSRVVFDRDAEDDGAHPGEFFDVLGLHEVFEESSEHLLDLQYKFPGSEQELLKIIRVSNAVIVLTDDSDTLRTAHLSRLPKEEDEYSANRNQGVWISLRECFSGIQAWRTMALAQVDEPDEAAWIGPWKRLKVDTAG